jgi:predicted RNA polymerase sigma factor
MATAKHHATDSIRRRKTLERKYEELGREVERNQKGRDLDAVTDEDFGDDLLGLIFMACHPVLSKDARVALTFASSAV